MAIPISAIIGLGIFALGLFLILMGILVAKAISTWRHSRTQTKYKQIAKKYRHGKFRQGRIVRPKMSTTFPTSTFPIQLETITSQDEDDNVQPPRTRKHDVLGGSMWQTADFNARRNRRVMSDSDLIMMTPNERDRAIMQCSIVKGIAQGDKGEKTRMRRSRSRSALSALAEISGQIEFTVYYDSARRNLQVNIIQVLDINEIMPDIVRDRCDIRDVKPDKDKPCLIREKDGRIAFSDMSELGICVEVTMFPKKRHIGTTRYKHEMNTSVFNEKFVVEHCSIDCYLGSSVRLQVLLRYGKHQQRPIIIGETIVFLKGIIADTIIPFTDYLKMPVDEDEFEDSLSEDHNLGKLVVSVRYQLLRQLLSIRIVGAKCLPKLGIYGQPSTSVKVNVYLNEIRQFKRTTGVAKKSTNPKFNYAFDIELARDKLNQIGILLEVRLHGAVFNTVLGYVHIGPAAEGAGGDHWDEVLSFSYYNSECLFDILDRRPRTICLEE